MSAIKDEQLYEHAEGLKGKVVLITGAASGIGQAAAIAFASFGAKVIIGDLNVAAGKHTVRECLRVGGTSGADAISLRCDVTSWEDQVELFNAGYEKYGRLDYVVANAGIAHAGDGSLALSGPQRGPPPKPSTKVLDVNLTGSIYTARLAQYYMMKNKSAEPKAMIFIGSMAGNNGLPKGEIYSASKHAVIGLTRSLYDDYKAWNIRTAAICPWFTDTPILPTSTKVVLAGIPLTPINRVAAAIVNASTDPDWNTSGATYTLPDDGEVFRIERHELSLGVYKLLHNRLVAIIGLQSTIGHYRAVIGDLIVLATPLLNVLVFTLPLLAYYFFFIRK